MRRLAVLLAACLAVSCGRGPAREPLVVLAASSLTDVFTELAGEYDGGAVSLRFGASSTLARQVAEGAPAGVLATADERSLAASGLPGGRVFARNRLVIVVERGNPQRISSVRDLARPGLVVVLCAPEVPCGRLGGGALAAAGVAVRARAYAENVRAVVSRVALGEADAGLAYATDVTPGVAAVADPVLARPEFQAAYAIAARGAAGAAWVAFVTGPRGRAALARHGFAPP